MKNQPPRCCRWIVGLLLCSTSGSAPAWADPPASTGVLTGVVRYTGTVPPVKKITTTDGSVIEHNDLVVEPKGKGLRHVIVTLEDAPPQPKLKKAPPVVVDQRDMVFLPRVVAVQHGQPVRFENNDICNHSVMGVSTLEANQFNIFAGPTHPIERVLELQKRPVMIGCSLHHWMKAWVYVAPHPWFAITDAKGTFRIGGIPPGKYTLLLHHPDTGRQERRPVEVQASRTTELTIEWQKTQ